MRFIRFGFIVFLLSAYASAADKIYSWVDAKGVTHFSYKMPSANDISEVTTIAVKKNSAYKTLAQVNIEQRNTQRSMSAELDRINEDNCVTASKNVKILNAFSTITQQGKDGQVITLSKLQRDAQLELANKQVDFFCRKL